MSKGYQHSSSNFGLGSGGNISSMNPQRNTGQMMPTPGFVNSGINKNNNTISQSYLSVEASNSNNSVGFSAAPMMVSQPHQQQQQQQPRLDTGGQNSRILHNLRSQMGVGLRAGMQQKISSLMNAKSVDSGSRSSQQAYDSLQRSGMQGKYLFSPFCNSFWLRVHQNI